MADEESGWGDYESGPFCRHWSSPLDCDEVCICSHTCTQHAFAEPGECNECECAQFTVVSS